MTDGGEGKAVALKDEDVKKASSAMLQKQLYAIFTVPTGGIEPILAGLEEHLGFQMQLEREGIMYAAGPMWSDDEKEWNGDGLVVGAKAVADEAHQKIVGRQAQRAGQRLVEHGRIGLTGPIGP